MVLLKQTVSVIPIFLKKKNRYHFSAWIMKNWKWIQVWLCQAFRFWKKEGFFLNIQKLCWSYYLLQTANLKKVNLSTKLWKTLANLGLTFPLQCVLVSRKQTKNYLNLFPFQSAYILLWFECICILHTVWGQDKYLSALFLTHTDLRNTEQVLVAHLHSQGRTWIPPLFLTLSRSIWSKKGMKAFFPCYCECCSVENLFS